MLNHFSKVNAFGNDRVGYSLDNVEKRGGASRYN